MSDLIYKSSHSDFALFSGSTETSAGSIYVSILTFLCGSVRPTIAWCFKDGENVFDYCARTIATALGQDKKLGPDQSRVTFWPV